MKNFQDKGSLIKSQEHRTRGSRFEGGNRGAAKRIQTKTSKGKK
ncbi:MAG: hypothetical protein WCO30_02885 [bacterium]